MLYVLYQNLWYAVSVNWPPFTHIQRFAAQKFRLLIIFLHPNNRQLKVLQFTLVEEIYIGRSIVEEAFVFCSKTNCNSSCCKEAVFFHTVPLTPAVICTYKCSQIIRNI